LLLLQFDAEILFWDGKTREQQHQMEFLSQEAARIEVATRLGEEQVCVGMPVQS
jgi:Ras association domain-containing protein 7/8